MKDLITIGIAFVACVVAAPYVLSSQSFDSQKLDKYFSILSENHKYEGSIALSKNGRIIYQSVSGYESVTPRKIKAVAKTKYRIGSMTKMFTSVMIFQLIDEGKLTLNTKLSKFYPKMRNSDQITIEQMLAHTSGIHNFTNDGDYLLWHQSAKPKDEMLKIFYELTPDFKPGANTSYSNTAYVLLGFIIEDITQISYAENLLSRISAKLNLADTYYMKDIKSTRHEAQSFDYSNGHYIASTSTHPDVPGGAGGIVSTPADMLTFVQALFSGKLIPETTFKKMLPADEAMGRGIYTIPFGERIAFGHNGTIDGFESIIAYFPEEKIGFAALSNMANCNVNDVYIDILNAYFNNQLTLPEFEKEVIIETAAAKKMSGVFVCKSHPLDITIINEKGGLFAQATGQARFTLTPIAHNKLAYKEADLIIEFPKAASGDFDVFKLTQAGATFIFKRQ